ncbi:MAG: DUF411 domain-containing protein [Gemmatimonadota bacterium]|nr:DUF411 domain-containing protein [Gemmatimonadota bacterium]MDE2870892.1 DUF411 domain-containing protein [Gemmatimonadota bacterium]
MKKLAAAALVLGGTLLVVSFRSPDPEPVTAIHVYKSPDCECCARWVTHMEAAGFEVTVRDTTDLAAVKRRTGVPLALWSCHTTVAGDYVIEGHVPARVVGRFLEKKPQVAGISVPGMPIGSPGMEGPNPQPYDVIAFDGKGNRTVFEQVDPRGSR